MNVNKPAFWTKKTVSIVTAILIAITALVIIVTQSDTNNANDMLIPPVSEQSQSTASALPEQVDAPIQTPIEDKAATQAAIEKAVSSWMTGDLAYEDAVDLLKSLENST